MNGLSGWVYLLHHDRPDRHVRHCIGKPGSSRFLNGRGAVLGRRAGRLRIPCRAWRVVAGESGRVKPCPRQAAPGRGTRPRIDDRRRHPRVGQLRATGPGGKTAWFTLCLRDRLDRVARRAKPEPEAEAGA